MSDTLMFVHIPKTAGTSFRRSATLLFGQDQSHFDYGAAAPETSELVRKWVYGARDLHGLGRALEAGRAKLFGGHVAAMRYLPLFGCLQAVSFLRAPARQVPSHFAHHVRHHGYRGSFAQFLVSAQGGRLQSSALAGPPLEALRFVGVTERYEESIAVLGHELGLAFHLRRDNLNPAADPDGDYEALVDEDGAQFTAACRADDLVYQRANALLDQRLAALRAGVPHVHGAVTVMDARRVEGFAFTAHGDTPVEVALHVDGQVHSQVGARLDRASLRNIGAPRSGYVGFSFGQALAVEPGARLEVRVAGTGQLLGGAVVE